MVLLSSWFPLRWRWHNVILRSAYQSVFSLYIKVHMYVVKMEVFIITFFTLYNIHPCSSYYWISFEPNDLSEVTCMRCVGSLSSFIVWDFCVCVWKQQPSKPWFTFVKMTVLPRFDWKQCIHTYMHMVFCISNCVVEIAYIHVIMFCHPLLFVK